MPAHQVPRFVPPKKAVKPQSSPKAQETPSAQRAPSPKQSRDNSAKKPKKRKRDSEALPDAQDEATPKKHKSILSKFEKASLRAQEAQKLQDEESEEDKPQVILRDLEPLPQPDPVPDPVFKPTFSVLPTWLAQPITTEASKRVPFKELGVETSFLKKLEKQGYTEALAVQSALLPMLQPGYEQHQGDICVSAKTGSGKTLAYLLPIIEALKDRTAPILTAIIVVPTRQLVDQALQVAEELCAGTKIKVGTAVGSVPFATEQKQLVKVRPKYDPERAAVLHGKAAKKWETGFDESGGVIEDLMDIPLDHIPQYDSNVDILICTPGRLVEHIESTTGFLLRSIKWLIIDEADQLLNQNFQGWATTLMDALHGETPEDMMNAQERIRKQIQDSHQDLIFPPPPRQLRKVILSATMEKDLTKLGMLRLKRPKLVSVLEEPAQLQPSTADGDVFELPSTLDEFAVAVGDPQKKPLYILYLLLHHVFSIKGDEEEEEEQEPNDTPTPAKPSIAQHNSRVLVFTKSNESASRLSHLLSTLEPSLRPYLRTMTPSATAKESKKLLRAFSSGSIKILIASDAASRGLDILDLTHVINYDMPSDTTRYVHRVGRTARAGKAGEAWTLFTKSEAAWFWNQLARGESIRRGGKKVKRVEWKEWNVTFNRKRTYEAALAELQEAVIGVAGEGK